MGIRNSTGTTFGAVVEITCDTGYDINGDSVITCGEDGSWSSVVTCDIKGTICKDKQITTIINIKHIKEK